LPFTSIHGNHSHSTFVVPNSYGYNPEKWIDGQNMNDWQTGGSNVLLKLLIRFVFGFEPTFRGVWIQPATWLPFKSFEFQIRVRKCDLTIRFQDRGGKPRSFSVNGDRHAGVHDPLMNLDKLWIPNDLLKKEKLDVRITQG
jgi:cellobiose phosphorylase